MSSRPESWCTLYEQARIGIIYYWVHDIEIILMLLVYAKKEKDDLTHEQLQALRKVVEREFK